MLERVAAAQPAPLPRDAEPDDLVAVGIERADHGLRRAERDVVLARLAAEEDGDPDPTAASPAGVAE